MKKIVLLCLSSFIFCIAFPQASDKQKVLEQMKELSARYKSADHLGFEMLYKYADENEPGVYLDSLKGSFKINHGAYWYMLDSTEFLGNKEISIALFKEDKIMFLSKPTTALQKMDLLALPDTFPSDDGMTFLFEDGKKERKISVEYAPGSDCKKAVYYIDKQTGFLSRMISVVQSSRLYEPSAGPLLDDSSSWAIIEVTYNNYRERGFDDGQLEAGKYYKIQGGEYVTTSAYQEYKIFFGSANLSDKE